MAANGLHLKTWGREKVGRVRFLSVHLLPAGVIYQYDSMFSLLQSFAKIPYLLALLLSPISSANINFFTFQLLYYSPWGFNGTLYEMLGK